MSFVWWLPVFYLLTRVNFNVPSQLVTEIIFLKIMVQSAKKSRSSKWYYMLGIFQKYMECLWKKFTPPSSVPGKRNWNVFLCRVTTKTKPCKKSQKKHNQIACLQSKQSHITINVTINICVNKNYLTLVLFIHTQNLKNSQTHQLHT